jgi:AcrR family transcriptional regulator
MGSPKKRTYVSEVRQRQADETRSRIASAALKLLEKKGYAGMTMEAVAQAAGVAVPTVYAIFRSKTGIIAEILDNSRFGDSYQEAVKEVLEATEPRERLKRVAGIAAKVHESEVSVLNLLRGAEAVAPELAQQDQELGEHRYSVQEFLVAELANAGYLRKELSVVKARDILWSLTGRDLYCSLVRDRGWTPKEYEVWLACTLLEALVSDS